jgi:membrane protease YdiL (CAAX protease family)
MRAFAKFIALMAIAVLGGALLAYPAYSLTQAWGADWPLHRVANRLAMLVLLIGLIVFLRRMSLANRADLGYGVERRRFLGLMLRALGIGALSMLPVIALLLLVGVREPRPDLEAGAVIATVVKGMLSGLVVAFSEETVLRGAMHSAMRRESGARMAIGLTALLYAALHFLGRSRIAHENVEWSSGLSLLAQTFSAYAEPTRIVDSFLALFAVGVLLGLVRERHGNIAACIGLHAGWVWVIAIARELTVRNAESPLSFLVGSYDGVVGHLVLVWTVVLTAIYWWTGRPQSTSIRA